MLTKHNAADMLGVSVEFINRQIEAGHISLSRIGRENVITFRELVRFKKAMQSKRQNSLDQMVEESEILGFYTF